MMEDFVSRMRDKTYSMVKTDEESEALKQNIASVMGMFSDPKCEVTLCGHEGVGELKIPIPEETIAEIDAAILAVQEDALKDAMDSETPSSKVVMGLYNASKETLVMLMQDASQRYVAAHPELGTNKYWGAGATMALQLWVNHRYGLHMNVDAYFILTSMASANGPELLCVEITTLVDGGAMTHMTNAECIRMFGEEQYAGLIKDATEGGDPDGAPRQYIPFGKMMIYLYSPDDIERVRGVLAKRSAPTPFAMVLPGRPARYSPEERAARTKLSARAWYYRNRIDKLTREGPKEHEVAINAAKRKLREINAELKRTEKP